MSDSPRTELALLAQGLAAHLRRREGHGERWVERPPRPAASAPAQERAEKAQKPAPEPRGGRSEAPAREESPAVAANRAKARAAGSLEELRQVVSQCTACELCETRTQTVFQDGDGSRRVLFVGEAPGQNEDEQGVPFVGRAGALLTDIIQKGMKIPREEVAIANVLKCRPPGNRDPKPEEKALCTPFLDRQIELLDPEVIVPLGLHASQHVLGRKESMGRMRQRVHTVDGRKVVPTYHPAYLLRSPGEKKACWADIQLAMGELGL